MRKRGGQEQVIEEARKKGGAGDLLVTGACWGWRNGGEAKQRRRTGMELRALDAAGVQMQSRERAKRCSSSMVLGSGTRHWRLCDWAMGKARRRQVGGLTALGSRGRSWSGGGRMGGWDKAPNF